MIDTRRMQAKALFGQIEAFLKHEPIPRNESKVSYSLKLDQYGEERLARERRDSLDVGIRSCTAYLEELKRYEGLWAGYGDLVTALMNRKNGLLKEVGQSEIVGISAVEKEDFGVDVLTVQQRLKFDTKKELSSPEEDKVLTCGGCGTMLKIIGIPPIDPRRPGQALLFPVQHCPRCGTQVGRAKSIKIE